jgi:1-acyl-sn-glycerol-3-phosphate acyltransferase
MNILYSFCHIIGRPLLKILFNLEVKGKENIPATGGVLLAANHASYLDPVVAGVASPRQLHFLAKEHLFEVRFLSWFARKTNVLPISRERIQVSITKKSLGILRKGGALLLFPEGTRSPSGTISEGKRGVGLIAYKANVPVVPVLIKGSDKALGRGAKWISVHKVSVTFSKPIYPEKSKEGTKKILYQRLSDKVMEEIKKMAGF